MSSFSGRTAVVTGAGGGMGLAIAVDLAARGARVVAVDVKEAPTELPDGVTFCRGDISDSGLAPEVVSLAGSISATGVVDMLVNAAGVAWFADPGLPPPPFVDGSIVDIDPAAWKRVLDINLTGSMLMTRAVLPGMRAHGAGSLVHIASIAGLRCADGALDAYQVSKAGLISLSRGLAAQYGPEGIRSNTVCPGAIVTPMIAGIYENDPAREQSMAARVPLRRVGTTADVCAAVTYLLSDDASFVTGTDLVVDGGWLTNMG
ncbi:NAD(P)-dependent dehydrogenase (short-subunit alcohol dehydrogenase family) [Nocardioides aromaticivorans]|uniref:NAD(P)-dependent dehydrogenase (Short-subunit alcohol dehydrogenase family) n=1 Tax=Nocardioides aromaticivorans TaxID=200618 RepID=A0A7Y9ZIG9_9ACTN|nr:SDR family oxidoreductase [Nocardioides aromaticivorans]NYI44545.1 NAD(P)-dependent dehydrogenase (short-subunit alcohol dehydrogenase family) [Nocardioides aromaticivorans]QSR28523.1 oxidoreductase [Nocardioides aromaticivorans]